MRHASRIAPLLLLIAITASCARATAGSENEEDRSSTTRLIASDIMATGERNLYDAVERLRPRWLQVRGVTSVQGAVPIVVYQDNVRVGGVSSLRGIRTEGVQEVRFVRGTDATTRWGMGLTSGVIEVISRRVRRSP